MPEMFLTVVFRHSSGINSARRPVGPFEGIRCLFSAIMRGYANRSVSPAWTPCRPSLDVVVLERREIQVGRSRPDKHVPAGTRCRHLALRLASSGFVAPDD